MQNSSDNLRSCPPDNHHSSGDVCWREQMKKLAVALSHPTRYLFYN